MQFLKFNQYCSFSKTAVINLPNIFRNIKLLWYTVIFSVYEIIIMGIKQRTFWSSFPNHPGLLHFILHVLCRDYLSSSRKLGESNSKQFIKMRFIS